MTFSERHLELQIRRPLLTKDVKPLWKFQGSKNRLAELKSPKIWEAYHRERELQ